MRISDWASDVCSSDLQRGGLGVEHGHAERDELLLALEARHLAVQLLQRLSRIAELPQEHPEEVLGLEGCDRRLDAVTSDVADHRGDAGGGHPEHVVEVAGHEPGSGLVDEAQLERSEEHTSELQSLMRLSYA